MAFLSCCNVNSVFYIRYQIRSVSRCLCVSNMQIEPFYRELYKYTSSSEEPVWLLGPFPEEIGTSHPPTGLATIDLLQSSSTSRPVAPRDKHWVSMPGTHRDFIPRPSCVWVDRHFGCSVSLTSSFARDPPQEFESVLYRYNAVMFTQSSDCHKDHVCFLFASIATTAESVSSVLSCDLRPGGQRSVGKPPRPPIFPTEEEAAVSVASSRGFARRLVCGPPKRMRGRRFEAWTWGPGCREPGCWSPRTRP